MKFLGVVQWMLRKSKKEGLNVGDLVYHLLYGKSWVAVVLGKTPPPGVLSDELTLVHIQPGTEYSGHFAKSYVRYRVTDNLGYVSTHWLRQLSKYEKSDLLS